MLYEEFLVPAHFQADAVLSGYQILQGLRGPEQFLLIVPPVLGLRRRSHPRPTLQGYVDSTSENDDGADEDDDGQFELQHDVLVVPQEAVIGLSPTQRPWRVLVSVFVQVGVIVHRHTLLLRLRHPDQCYVHTDLRQPADH